ncbi:abortive infection family protein [Peribacillus frigoritolerans]|uniref:abortive infection family protein n=1 Tax=Peribacillus frigoritolerans TaxID=450367 RepID=UPI002570463A|nr:abortive infection family protein [Peribacillus frigoritolerans]WJE48932.1 abortive infection family protein [Peribacillus frigoritolerans]
MKNPSVILLENCKTGLRNTYVDCVSTRNGLSDYNLYLSDDDFLQARLIILKLCEERGIEVPNGINTCRSVEEFTRFLTFDIDPFGDNMEYITSLFNPFIDYVEMKNIEVKILHIECKVPQELSYSHILEDISKCENRIEIGDYSGALTSARSLIEGVCKEIIYNIEKEEITGSPNLPELFKTVRNHLNLDPSNEALQKPLKQVVSGLIQVVHGLNEIRNVSGDGHTRKVTPSLHHALLVVNSAKTVVNFLFHTYEYQRNLGKIKFNGVSSS